MDNKLKQILAETKEYESYSKDQLLIKINMLMISYEAKIESLERIIKDFNKTQKYMANRKDIEYMENEIKKNTKLSHDIYCCLIESIDNYYDNDIKKPIVSLDKATIKIFYLIKGILDNYYNT